MPLTILARYSSQGRPTTAIDAIRLIHIYLCKFAPLDFNNTSLTCLHTHKYTKRSWCIFQVEQRDVPGIDCAFLAMDTEEGVEVVWNEVQFSERKNFKNQEEKIQTVFENLTQLDHPNIVKFHRYWTDTHNDRPRVSGRFTQ